MTQPQNKKHEEQVAHEVMTPLPHQAQLREEDINPFARGCNDVQRGAISTYSPPQSEGGGCECGCLSWCCFWRSSNSNQGFVVLEHQQQKQPASIDADQVVDSSKTSEIELKALHELVVTAVNTLQSEKSASQQAVLDPASN